MKLRFLLPLLALIITAIPAKADDVQEAHALALRLSERLAGKVEFVKISPLQKGADVFTLSNGADGRVVIGGNNANSMAVGLNRYLKKYCNVTVSWYGDIAVELPATLPQVNEERVTSRVPQRFFLNYCTYGYTMTYWGWREWERFIDWMALNGINLPLNITGQEAVWQKVWMKMGMTAEETRNYFTGPSYLPWHRMANIDHWCGPLPQEWLDDQVELQKQILARERALNMRPVLPAFAGHVPRRIKELYPDADIKMLEPWNYFPEECYTFFMNSEDPLFAKIQKAFIEEQTALFGTDHIYGFDPFNEVDPPVWEPKYINRVTKHMYQSLAKVDKKAEWLLMGWFYYFNKNWTTERVKAMMDAVPRGRLTILDYHCDNTEVWRANKSFHGQNFIWCYLGNFGGNTILQGNPRQSEERLETAYAENGSNLTGIGSTLEGLDMQQMPYEVILDRAWALGERDVATETADRHAGHVSENIRAAWKVLYNEVYTEVSSSHGDLANFIPQMGKGGGMFRPINVNSEALLKATKLLLSDDKAPSDALKTDIIVSVRHLLNHKFQREKTAFDKSFEEKDIAAMRRHGTMMLELLADIDKITMFHPYSTMDKWVGLAREYGTTEHLKDYYEMNATRLVTTWGPNLNDYANRSLSGLISTYYTKRWEIYIDEAMNAVSKGLDFNSESNNKRQQELSESYRYTGGTNHIKPGDDLISTARLIVKKYF